MKDFSIFVILSKTALTIFFKLVYLLIKCYELLVVHIRSVAVISNKKETNVKAGYHTSWFFILFFTLFFFFLGINWRAFWFTPLWTPVTNSLLNQRLLVRFSAYHIQLFSQSLFLLTLSLSPSPHFFSYLKNIINFKMFRQRTLISL